MAVATVDVAVGAVVVVAATVVAFHVSGLHDVGVIRFKLDAKKNPFSSTQGLLPI